MSEIPQYLVGPFQETYQQLLNQSLQDKIGANGFQVTKLTAAEIAIVTGMNFLPILPEGTIFRDITNKLWKGIDTEAVRGVSNAILRTFTVT